MGQYGVIQNVEIINEIIKIETGAREMIKNAEREKDGLEEAVSAILDGYRAEQQESAQKKIESVSFAEQTAAKKETDRIYSEYGQKLEKLKKITEENMEKWVGEVYGYMTEPTELRVES